jgi:hypothetical protein
MPKTHLTVSAVFLRCGFPDFECRRLLQAALVVPVCQGVGQNCCGFQGLLDGPRHLHALCPNCDMTSFDWHRDAITRETPIAASYRNTQNVRRFFKAECGEHFKFNRVFMAWLRDGSPKTMGDAADEWTRRYRAPK